MWIRVKSMDSDVWKNEAGQNLQPQFKQVDRGTRVMKISVEGFPPLIGRLGKVMKQFNEDDGTYYAVHMSQDLMQTCPQDYWIFKPEDVEVINIENYTQEMQEFMVSWMKVY